MQLNLMRNFFRMKTIIRSNYIGALKVGENRQYGF